MDLRFDEGPGNRWDKRLTLPISDSGRARPGCGASRVRLINRRRIGQGYIAGTGGDIQSAGEDACLKVSLRSVGQATARRRCRQSKVLHSCCALVNDDVCRGARRKGRLARRFGGIGTRRNCRKRIETGAISCRCSSTEGHGGTVYRSAAGRYGNRPLQRAVPDGSTWRKLKLAYPGQPPMIEGLIRWVRIFAGVPKSTAVGIDCHRAVVAPTRGARLRSCSVQKRRLG